MQFNYYLVNSFSHQHFTGNPTPVCLLEKDLSRYQMHELAIKFNAPVTAFVNISSPGGALPIRYFTKTGEINACGHATLASAYVLLKETEAKEISFITIENITLLATKLNEILFIQYPLFEVMPFNFPPNLYASLGNPKIRTEFYCSELESLFLHLTSDSEVKNMSPDFDKLLKSSSTIKEVVVMSESFDLAYDFVLRSFCPWIGINEDPVTGSVHSVLAPYWKNLTGKNELLAYQASANGGVVHTRLNGSFVQIGGRNEITSKGLLSPTPSINIH